MTTYNLLDPQSPERRMEITLEGSGSMRKVVAIKEKEMAPKEIYVEITLTDKEILTKLGDTVRSEERQRISQVLREHGLPWWMAYRCADCALADKPCAFRELGVSPACAEIQLPDKELPDPLDVAEEG